MPRATYAVPYTVDPDPRNRLIVKRGYAIPASNGKSVRYDKEALARLWAEWPSMSQVDFGRYWGIPYSVVNSPKYPLSIVVKRRELAEQKMTYRAAIVRRAMLPPVVDEASEIAALREMLRGANELSLAGLGYARAKMIRKTDIGYAVPNTSLPPKHALAAMRVGEAAMKIAAAYSMIRTAAKGDVRDDPTSRVRPEIVATSPSEPRV